MATEVERAATILEGKRYAIGIIYDGPEYSLVTFYDRATLRPEWDGPNVVGKVTFLSREIAKARREKTQSHLVQMRVRQAELRLLNEVGRTRIKETTALKDILIKASLSVLAVYPFAGRLF